MPDGDLLYVDDMELVTPSYTFSPMCRCIYCGKTDVKLGREHIIPFSLNGRLVLPNASCDKCSDIINQFEGPLSGSMLKKLRRAQNFSSYKDRAHKEGKPIDFRFDEEDVGDGVSVAPAEYPIAIALPVLSPPLLYIPKRICKYDVNIKVFIEARRFEAVMPQIYDRKMHVQSFDLVPFIRLFGKIAHSFAFAILGEERLSRYELFLPEIIMHHDSQSWKSYIGCMYPIKGEIVYDTAADRLWNRGYPSDFIGTDNTVETHRISLFLLKTVDKDGTVKIGGKQKSYHENIIVKLRLFNYLGMRDQMIIVGRRVIDANADIPPPDCVYRATKLRTHDKSPGYMSSSCATVVASRLAPNPP